MTSPSSTTDITIVGVGAIGSAVVEPMARGGGSGRLTIVDRDRYERKNLDSAVGVRSADIDKPKAIVQARRAARINRWLKAVPLVQSVEHVPLGALRGDVVLLGLDSRQARIHAARAAWRLGVPLVDAGIDAKLQTVRVSVFVPSAGGPCFECGLYDEDYAAIEQQQPCWKKVGRNGAADAPPTNATASLASLAASLQAIEAEKILHGHIDQQTPGRQIYLDTRHCQWQATWRRRNSDCRFDHEIWTFDRATFISGATTLADLFGHAFDGHGELHVEGHAVARSLTCPSCGDAKKALRLTGRLSASLRRCRNCSGVMVADGFEIAESLSLADLTAKQKNVRLSRLGFQHGDIVTLRRGGECRRFELTSPIGQRGAMNDA